ncbi:hypothetical protein ACH492_38055 [Streptomyces sp. NPDC019443]|uniref:hypothetical protein n=1 Tax=Streptomyces sp. NPDC019443 TaxID=3365061 RepID=UPI0037A460AB
MNLRMIGLTAVVVFTGLLPLAASAGPVGGTSRAKGSGGGLRPGSGAISAFVPAPDPPLGDKGRPKPEPGLLPGPGASPAVGVSRPTAPHTSAQCGPELASPDGVEAQTCVLTEGRDTWARTYYRNATGEELTSLLTLMGPGGRTLQINCVVEVGGEPDVCETPREASRGAVAGYSAVAEFATADEVGEGPLLLRSGSNSASPAGR